MTKRLILVVAVLAAAFSAFATTAKADTPTFTVSFDACAAANGGSVNVPAGSDVTLGEGWEAKTKLLVGLGVLDSYVDVTVNGQHVRNPWQYWGQIQQGQGDYFSLWKDDLGVLTGPTTISFTWRILLPIVDGESTNPDGTPYIFFGNIFSGSCTITPV